MRFPRLLTLILFVLVSQFTHAGVIDFETNALGQTPTDNEVMPLNQSFQVDGVSISFGFDTDFDGIVDSPAAFEQSGYQGAGEDTGFWGIDGAKDTAAPGFENVLGDFFLRQQNPYQPFGVFVISYDSVDKISAASGEIWDIDGNTINNEQFTVKAFEDQALLQTIQSPIGNTLDLDGKPWRFGFENLSNITRIEISFSGTKTKGIGLAFDNFYPEKNKAAPTAVSEPNMPLLLMVSIALILVTRAPLKR